MENVRVITTFIHSVKAGNFSNAARELGITPQAVSLHIKQLEDLVGVRLFNRSTRTMALTEEGVSFYNTCSTATDSIQEGIDRLRNSTAEVFGTVRVAAPYGFGRLFVAPAIGRFLDLYPRVSVDLVIQNRLPDILSAGIDVGILADPLPDNSLIARKVATSSVIHCASPSYLRRFGVPTCIKDLSKHHCINLRNWVDGVILPWKFRENDRVITHEVNARFTTDDGDAAVEAVLSGAGIAQLSGYRVAPYIRSKQIVPILTAHANGHFDFYIYTQRRTHIPKKNKVFADFLYEDLRGHPDLRPF